MRRDRIRLALGAVATLMFSVRAFAGEPAWVAADRPDPRLSYRTFAVACDSLCAITRRALGAWADSARWVERREGFTYHDRPRLQRSNPGEAYWTLEGRDSSVLCLRMQLQHRTAGAPGSSAIGRALEASGWVADAQYDADGPDGTVFALVCREALCEIEGRWDGGDDSDSTSVPEPGETVILRCVPRPAFDPRPNPTGH
jgi:hypothetical protein